ncbi:serine/threonine-protein kinase-like protein CCR4 [Senna tora]|uniref:Serine/threonine-protein kinase-like protein CCR4 n=1 Tax=Senna tora TaxID=362788 RepID=A0A834TMG2_9FABA|nr:serine/threonine-protein kinase-like protein CCR4 [Senna tora]
MFCWRFSSNSTNVAPKRVYHGPIIQNLNAGNTSICGLAASSNTNNTLNCWQWRDFNYSINNLSNIAVGFNFVCGVSSYTNNIHCVGTSDNTVVVDHFKRTANTYSLIAATTSYVCAIFSSNGSLDCWGDMLPSAPLPQGNFIALALGQNGGCAIRATNQTVECWGSHNFSMPLSLRDTYFEAITAKQSVFCGVKSDDLSLHCWGQNDTLGPNATKVFDNVLPGPCRNEDQCPCGPMLNSASLCNQGIICKPCVSPIQAQSQPPPPAAPMSGNSDWSKKMVAFLVVGCVGSASLLLVLAFFLYKYCKRRGCRRVHDSGRLEDNPEALPEDPEAEHGAQPVLEKRLSHMFSLGNGGHLEEFSLQLLMKVTNNFSEHHKIGTGSFGSVYHATLEDGRQVAIKRAEISATSPSYRIQGGITKHQQEKDNDHAFVNELEALSRLNHKNLVRLVGFFEDTNERILVYEFMTNGNLSDHLHDLNNTTTSSSDSPLTSWAGRIKIALDAARGIEYLHQYAIPPIIHRDIKSANILLDAKWTAKVSDFGLSLMGPDPEEGHSHLSLLAAGTVGYMDPEYYRLQHLTTKSDVYSFGVVLLELLCGYKAIHRNEDGMPRNVVDFVVPYIVQDEIHRVLDRRVPPPTPYEIEGVAFVGYLAADCVRLEGRDRPSMTQVVDSLEKALAACLVPPALSWSSTTNSSDLSYALN